jgi:hypothetical protein
LAKVFFFSRKDFFRLFFPRELSQSADPKARFGLGSLAGWPDEFVKNIAQNVAF